MKREKKTIKSLFIGGVVILIIMGVLAGGTYFFYLRHLSRIELYNKYHSEIQFVKKLSNVIFFPWLFTPEKLERYDLLINRQDLYFLNSNLPPGYVGALLTEQNRQPVKAEFIVDGKKLAVEVRYRGDTDVHWRDPQKSWRIDFALDQLFEGKESIHLVIPVDRGYLLEELSFYRAKKMGLAVPETKFVNLFVNGERQGVYWQFEQWGEGFLAKNNVSTPTNLYGSIEFADLTSTQTSGFTNVNAWRKYVSSPAGGDDYSDLQQLIDVINNPSDEEFNQKIGNIVDLDNFYAWQINQYLMTSNHQSGINLRFYFDPAAGKFKFIPWDILIAEIPPPYFEENYNQLITRVLSNPEFLHQRNIKLWQYVGNEDNLNDDLNFYDQLDQQTRNDFYKDSLKTESHLAYRKKITEFKNQVIERVRALQNNLRYATAKIEIAVASSRLVLKVKTDGFSAIELNKISVQQESCLNQLRLFSDDNDNGLIDYSDQLITTLSCNNGNYSAEVKTLIYATKVINGNYLKPGENHKSFILTDTGRIDQEKVNFIIHNAVTDELVEPNLE